MGIKSGDLKNILSHFPSGVTIVTTNVLGKVHGTTISAFSAVSLDPPLILICVDQDSEINKLIIESGFFGVNFLKFDQGLLSDMLATKALDPDQTINDGVSLLGGNSFTLGKTGSPVFDEKLAYLECSVHSTVITGDHTLYIGQVENGDVSSSNDEPLIYFKRKYRAINLDS
jgi:flavin reductase (DIM6/NTAB) family NADH-FMN oxidoreductase RutF